MFIIAALTKKNYKSKAISLSLNKFITPEAMAKNLHILMKFWS
jgi:hypothetical protein